MSEPTCVTQLIHAANHFGWGRLALLTVPLPVLSDWCRERGWDRMADWLIVGMPYNSPTEVNNYIRWFCEDESRFKFAVEIGRGVVSLRNPEIVPR